MPVISCPLPDPRQISQALAVAHYIIKPVTRERLLSLLADYGTAVQRILIVDDDVQFVELVARIVQSAPGRYIVDTACGGEEGIAQMQKNRPDLVLLDLAMQEVDGLTVLHFMRADDRLHDVPVALVTAHDLPGEGTHLLLGNTVSMAGPESLTTTEVLTCVQGILDALPAPKSMPPLPSKPAANPPAQSVS